LLKENKFKKGDVMGFEKSSVEDLSNTCLKIAANMLRTQERQQYLNDGDPSFLNKSLVEELKAVDDLVHCASNGEGLLRSRQVIATVIVNWSFRHPGERPYGDGA
jgi:hypothetical protein